MVSLFYRMWFLFTCLRTTNHDEDIKREKEYHSELFIRMNFFSQTIKLQFTPYGHRLSIYDNELKILFRSTSYSKPLKLKVPFYFERLSSIILQQSPSTSTILNNSCSGLKVKVLKSSIKCVKIPMTTRFLILV